MDKPTFEQICLAATLGESVLKDLGIDSTKIFDEAMEKFKDKEPIEQLRFASRDFHRAILNEVPVWMRINAISHSLSGPDENNILWDDVNKTLTSNIDPYDFNVVDEIKNKQDFYALAANAHFAAAEMGAWRREKCKNCSKVFYMNKGEVEFFKKKGFPLPKRCSDCRQAKKSDVDATKAKKDVKSFLKIVDTLSDGCAVDTISNQSSVPLRSNNDDKTQNTMTAAFEKAGYFNNKKES